MKKLYFQVSWEKYLPAHDFLWRCVLDVKRSEMYHLSTTFTKVVS